MCLTLWGALYAVLQCNGWGAHRVTRHKQQRVADILERALLFVCCREARVRVCVCVHM